MLFHLYGAGNVKSLFIFEEYLVFSAILLHYVSMVYDKWYHNWCLIRGCSCGPLDGRKDTTRPLKCITFYFIVILEGKNHFIYISFLTKSSVACLDAGLPITCFIF